MNWLADDLVVRTLDRLHAEAAISDEELVKTLLAKIEAPGATIEQFAADAIAQERADYRGVYRGYADNFLAVSPDYGRFLYMMARASRATRIVEFGTSMGISTVYLAAALRDNGGGQLIGSELEVSKVARALANLRSAGLETLVDIRAGDALETLRDPGGAVDLLMLDGAFSLYLPVLRLIEPHLRPGAIVLAENALEPDYRGYVRDPANGYVSLPALDEGRGNEISVRAA